MPEKFAAVQASVLRIQAMQLLEVGYGIGFANILKAFLCQATLGPLADVLSPSAARTPECR